MPIAVLRTLVLAGIILLLTAPVSRGQTITVTLLGTGGPPPVMNRFGPSILVQAGGENLLFDAGRGAIQRLFQLGVPLKDVRSLFLTHLHSDHIVGIPDLFLTAWITGQREETMRVWGPAGTKEMMKHLEQAFGFDIQIRLANAPLSRKGVQLDVHEITEGVVYEQNGVRVTAFEVDHAEVKPAYGYRVDFGKRSVVLSGDTRFSENLVRHARGADVVVHEVVVPGSLRKAGFAEARAKGIIGHHTTPERAGEAFSRINPRLAVYSHIILPSVTAEDLVGPTRTTYAGPLEVGDDLMTIGIGDSIQVRRQVR